MRRPRSRLERRVLTEAEIKERTRVLEEARQRREDAYERMREIVIELTGDPQ